MNESELKFYLGDRVEIIADSVWYGKQATIVEIETRSNIAAWAIYTVELDNGMSRCYTEKDMKRV